MGGTWIIVCFHPKLLYELFLNHIRPFTCGLALSNWDESDRFSQSPSSAERFVVVDNQSDYSGNIQSFESDEIVEVLDEILIVPSFDESNQEYLI